MKDQERASALITEIAQAVVNDDDFRTLDWESLSLVSIVDSGMADMSGYAYDANGEPTACSPNDFAILDLMTELAEAMQEPDGKTWKTALLQIERATGRIHMTYEYNDRQRWKVTPANYKTKPQELRFQPEG